MVPKLPPGEYHDTVVRALGELQKRQTKAADGK
jgi:hypothetical protein